MKPSTRSTLRLPFLVGAVALFVMALSSPDEGQEMLVGVGVVSLLVAFSFCSQGARLEITSEGVTDRQLGVGLIPWHEIDHIDVRQDRLHQPGAIPMSESGSSHRYRRIGEPRTGSLPQLEAPLALPSRRCWRSAARVFATSSHHRRRTN